MKHKFLTVLLALVAAFCLCFGLAACGGIGGNGGGDVNNGGGTNPGGTQKPDDGSQKPDDGTQKPEHVHTFTVDNVCSGCGDKWEYTEGLEYTLDATTDTYAVTGIGTASGNIVIPYGYEGKFVTKIGDEAFKGSDAVTGIFVPEKIVSVGKGAFLGCANLISATWDAENCTKAGISEDEGSETPGGVINPFEYCIFYDTGLKALTLGGHVKTIPLYAFAFCDKLAGELKIPDGVTSIGSAAFAGCDSLTSITIPDGVTSIRDVTFDDCSSLTSITIPDSVTSFGIGAFMLCSSLTDIQFKGTVQQWKAIQKGFGWNNNINYEYTVTCTDGKIARDGTVTKN